MEKKYLGLLFLIYIGFSSTAQDINFKVDQTSIEKISDTLQFDRAVQELTNLVASSQFERAENYANLLVNKGKQMKFHRGLGNVYIQKGRIYKDTHDHIQAVKSYNHAEESYKKAKSITGLAITANDRYVLEINSGNTEKSADYLLEAKMYYEKLQDSSGLSRVYNNLGNVYANLDNFETSEKYYLKAIKTNKSLNELEDIGMTMNNLALLYIEADYFKKAKKLLYEALQINKDVDDKESIAQSYSILAKTFLYEENYEIASKYYDTTLCISSQTNFKLLTTNAKQQKGIIAIQLREFDKAEKLLKKAREEFETYNATPLLLKNYQFSSKLDSARGNLSGALAWQKEYQKLSDKRLTEASAKKVARAEARYKAELQQLRLIDEQEKREQLTKAQLFKYRVATYVTGVILVIIFIFMFFFLKARKERNRLIKKLNESNQIKNKLFSIISHDLKNEIHGLEGSLNLLKENAISQEEFKEIIPLLANRTHQTSILLNNLLNWSKSQLKELNANPTEFDITEVISDKFTFFMPKANQKGIQLVNNLDKTKIYADKDMFGIVAQNLIANAIKFCNPGDSIALEAEEKKDCYEICFIDTGIGIESEDIHRLFAEETYTTNGTQNETGTGLGLRICKELIELNRGKIQVKSKPGEGSSFCIYLPKAA